MTLRLRDKYYPEAKVSVLSNATLAGRESVFQALRKVDNPIMKLDASTDELAQMMSAGTLTEAALNNAREMLGV